MPTSASRVSSPRPSHVRGALSPTITDRANTNTGTQTRCLGTAACIRLRLEARTSAVAATWPSFLHEDEEPQLTSGAPSKQYHSALLEASFAAVAAMRATRMELRNVVVMISPEERPWRHASHARATAQHDKKRTWLSVASSVLMVVFAAIMHGIWCVLRAAVSSFATSQKNGWGRAPWGRKNKQTAGIEPLSKGVKGPFSTWAAYLDKETTPRDSSKSDPPNQLTLAEVAKCLGTQWQSMDADDRVVYKKIVDHTMALITWSMRAAWVADR